MNRPASILTALPLCLAPAGTASATFVQFDLSASLNRDVVFSTSAGDTALAADGDRAALATLSAVLASADPDPAGMPDAGTVAFGGGTIQFADYTADNAVHFTQNGGFSVSAANPVLYDTLHGFATNSNSDLDVTLNYADGSSVIRVEANNWVNNPVQPDVLVLNTDRYDTVDNTVVDSDSLSIFNIAVLVNPTRTLQSLDVVQVNQGLNRTIYTNVLAVTGNTVPEPAGLFVLAAAPALLRRHRRA